MEANEHTIKLYGRNVLKMVEQMKAEPDREKRSRQAAGIVRVMEILNPQVHQQENFAQKLWDHLYLIAGLDLDIDSPYPVPEPEVIASRPEIIPLKQKPLKARHYGRNIESIIDLIATEPEGEIKTAMIRSLAIYMRQQYLIWNKDSVSDDTIFQDIERLSEGRVKVPEGLELTKIQMDGRLARPALNLNMGSRRVRGRRGGKKK